MSTINLKGIFKVFIFAIALLDIGCSKVVHNSFKLDVNSDQNISAIFKINKNTNVKIGRAYRSRYRTGLIAYPVRQIDGQLYGSKKDICLSIDLFEKNDKIEDILKKHADLFTQIGSVEYHSPSVIITKLPDFPEDGIEIVKAFRLNDKNFSLSLRIESNNPNGLISESELAFLLDFMDNIEITKLEKYFTIRKRKKWKGFSGQQSD